MTVDNELGVSDDLRVDTLRVDTSEVIVLPEAGEGAAAAGGHPAAGGQRWLAQLRSAGGRMVSLLLHLLRLLPEFALIVGGYAIYTLVRDGVHGRVADAVGRGLEILRLEAAVHLDPERALNHFVAAHPAVAWICDYYYATGHFVITIAVLVLLYWRAPKIARRYAGAWYCMNLLALIGFWQFALAPPRLLAHAGFIDTVVKFHTAVNWNSHDVAAASNQYAAMPSLHVGWAAWCAVTVFALTRRRWIRVLAVAYPVLTTIIVLGTANHYVADTVAGVLVTALGFGAQSFVSRGLGWLRRTLRIPARTGRRWLGWAASPAADPVDSLRAGR